MNNLNKQHSVFLQGGLGNQLFQISTAYAHAEVTGDTLILQDGQHHLPLQGSNVESYKDNLYLKLKFSKNFDRSSFTLFQEPSFKFTRLPYARDLYLSGYFQSEKYFKPYRKDLLDLYNIEFLTNKHVKDIEDNTISLHVRRGDYLKLQDSHPCLNLSYYQKALEEFPPDYPVLVFSDDIEWCKSHFTSDRFKFMEGNSDLVDLLTMTKCTHHIIANSSFSWWGAWLSESEGIKIAPEKWFGPSGPQDTEDLIPENWKKVL